MPFELNSNELIPLFDTTRPPAHHDPMVAYALNRIYNDTGDKCKVDRKDLKKHGFNPSVGTSTAPINSWNAVETYQTSNVILNISSTNASDTGVVSIEHMTLDGGNLTFGTQEVTLTGQTPVALPTAAARWMRMATSDTHVGDIYIYRGATTAGGAPTTIENTHNHIPAGYNRSQKAATSVSSTNYLLLDLHYGDVVKKTGAGAEIRLKEKLISEDDIIPMTADELSACLEFIDLRQPSNAFSSYKIHPDDLNTLCSLKPIGAVRLES